MKNIAPKIFYTSLLIICISITSFGQTTETLHKKALLALKQKRYKEALEACNKAALNNPKNAQIYFTKAKLYKALNQPMNALQSVELAIKRASTPSAKMYYLQGRLYESFKSYKPAVKAYSQAIKINKTLAKAYFRRGQTYSKSNLHNSYTLARKDFKNTLEINPKHVGAYLGLASYYCDDEAKHDKAYKIYLKGIQQVKNPTKLLMARGELYLRQNSMGRALRDFLKASLLDTNNVDIYNKLADHYYTLKDLDKNIYYSKKAIKAAKDDASKSHIYNNLGVAYEQQGKYDLAKEAFLLAIRTNLEHKRAYENLEIILDVKNEPDEALILFNKGQSTVNQTKALKFFNQAILTRPQFLMAHVHKAALLREYHQYTYAIKSYSRALLLAPKYSWLWVNRGEVYHKINKFKLALYNYDKALKLKPTNSETYHLKSLTYQHMGNMKQAIAMVDSALKYSPYNIFYHTRKGILLSFEKEYSKAKTYFDFVIQLRPRYTLARYFRGVLYFHHHQYDQARKDLYQVYKIEQDFNVFGKRYNILTTRAYNYLAKYHMLTKGDKLYVKELKKQAYKRINALLKDVNTQISSATQNKSEALLYELKQIKAKYLVVKAEMEVLWNRTNKTVGLLDQAYQLGLKTYEPVFNSGFDNVRDSPEFQQLLKKHQLKLTNVPQTKNARYYFMQAIQAKQLHQTNKAIGYLDIAIKMNAQAQYFSERALLKIKKDKVNGALQDLNQAIRLNKRSYISYLTRAKTMAFYYSEKSKAQSDINRITNFKNHQRMVAPVILCQAYALKSRLSKSTKKATEAKQQSIDILDKLASSITKKEELIILKASVFSMLGEHQRAIGALKIGLASGDISVKHLNNLNFAPLYQEPAFKQLLQKYNR